LNESFKREIELAQYTALQGDANIFFDHEERIHALDIHGDNAPIELLQKCKLIAALRADRFKTASETWDNLKNAMSKTEKQKLWNLLLEVPEFEDPEYVDLINMIVGDPNKGRALLSDKVKTLTTFAVLIIIGVSGIWYGYRNDALGVKTFVLALFDSVANPLPSSDPVSKVQLIEDVSQSVIMLVWVCDITFPNGTTRQDPFAHGSGFVIDNNGLVLTNEHVVALDFEGCTDYMHQKWASDNGKVTDINLYALVQVPEPHHVLIEIDDIEIPDNNLDLAIVRVKEKALRPVQLRSELPKEGTEVIVIGYRGSSKRTKDSMEGKDKEHGFVLDHSDPKSFLSFMWSADMKPTHSSGTVTKIDSYNYSGGKAGQYKVLETDAMTNSGNSGGPMFDMHKNVIGMLSFGNPNDSAVNNCISSKSISEILEEWRRAEGTDENIQEE